MRLAIIGCGAMGSLFAAYLSTFVEVVMVGHWRQQLEKIHKEGLVLIRPDGQRSTHHIPASDKATDFPPVKLALILVKAYQTARAAEDAANILADDGIALTLQNGLGNVPRLTAVLGTNRVAQGITALGATMIEPGLVRHAGFGMTHIARLPVHNQVLIDLIRFLNQTGLSTSFAENLDSLVWGKLVINAGINPLTAILQVPNGRLVTDDQLQSLMCAVVIEAANVAQALNITLPYDDPLEQVKNVAKATAANKSSMLQDRQRGAQTEIEFISGAIADEGAKNGVHTPLNQEFLRIMTSQDIWDAVAQSPYSAIQELKKYR